MNFIQIGAESIPVYVTKSRGRRISMQVDMAKRALRVRTPDGKLNEDAIQFIRQKSSWIQKHLNRKRERDQRADHFLKAIRGGIIPFKGVPYEVIFETGPRRSFRRNNDEKKIWLQLLESDPPAHRVWHLGQGLKMTAKELLPARVEQLATATESKINRVFVKGQKTRWGSCSSKRNINLNWHLILLDQALIDYIIIHELMHLREMNHSPRFWYWVQKFYPDYKSAEKRIREYEWMIGIFDAV